MEETFNLFNVPSQVNNQIELIVMKQIKWNSQSYIKVHNQGKQLSTYLPTDPSFWSESSLSLSSDPVSCN